MWLFLSFSYYKYFLFVRILSTLMTPGVEQCLSATLLNKPDVNVCMCLPVNVCWKQNEDGGRSSFNTEIFMW